MSAASAAPPTHAPSADDVAKARELFVRAQADEARGDYLSALEKFERVAETKDTASVRFHLGHCSEKLGRLASALHHYNLALHEGERESSAEVKRASTKAAEALAPRVPKLTIQCPADIPSCSVSLDGRTLGAGELSVFILVDPGRHHVSARAEGMQTVDVDLSLHESEARTLQIAFSPAPTTTPTAPHGSGAPEGLTTREAAPRDGGSKTGAFLALGGAVALAAFGVGSFVGAGGAQDSLKAACAARPSCEDEKSSVRTWDTLALVSFVSAGALAVVATVLFVKPTASKATSRRVWHLGHEGIGATF